MDVASSARRTHLPLSRLFTLKKAISSHPAYRLLKLLPLARAHGSGAGVSRQVVKESLWERTGSCPREAWRTRAHIVPHLVHHELAAALLLAAEGRRVSSEQRAMQRCVQGVSSGESQELELAIFPARPCYPRGPGNTLPARCSQCPLISGSQKRPSRS